MIKFPKIESFKNARYHANKLGAKRVTYRGSVKLHGTNASLAIYPDGRVVPQSRNRELTLEKDNCGFAAYVHEAIKANPDGLNVLKSMAAGSKEPLVIYGEWIGPGVQQGVAITQAPGKRWAIFPTSRGLAQFLGVHFRAIQNEYMWMFDVDMSTEASVREFQAEVHRLTQEVEECCPFAKRHFEVEGIGEGIVWVCREYPELAFKSKGEKHSKTKVKAFKAPKEVDPRVIAFAEKAVTGDRVDGAIAYLREMNLPTDKSSTGAFLKYFMDDVRTELSLELEEAGLSMHDVGKEVSTRARETYFDRVNCL